MKKIWIIILLCISISANAQQITFSHQSGFYSEGFSLEINTSSPLPSDYSIRYTTNGFDPTSQSTLYSAPFFLDSNCYSNFNLFAIQNAPDDIWAPPSSVEHIIVVKAAIFDSYGIKHGNIITASYVISSLLGRNILLPVMSICVDSAALLSHESGIFIPGRFFDPSDPHWTGNYYQSGSEWERLAHIDYLIDSKSTLSQYCGIRTHGGNSRRLMQKGFTLYAREDYGTKNFNYSFFENYSISKFKRLSLKPMSSSWTNAGIQDWLSQMLAQGYSFDHLAVQPIVLFLNGEYWGIYLLEEKPDEHYVDNHYGFNNDDIDLIGNWFGLEENGSNQAFLSMMDYLKDADLKDQEAYNNFIRTINFDAFIDYQLFEMFIGNSDWPANNMRCWQYDDSPWQWIFYDGDACFSKFDAIDNAFCEAPSDEWPSNSQSTLMFRRLCENDNCVAYVIAKMEQMLNSLSYNKVVSIIDSAQLYLENEINHQIARFHYPTSTQDWDMEINDIRRYFRQAPTIMRSKLCDYLEIADNTISNISLFPNPMSSRATIQFESEKSGFTIIKIFDLHGNQRLEKVVSISSGKNDIQLTPILPIGLYIVRIGNTSIKLVIGNF